jgi:hypothetical protein
MNVLRPSSAVDPVSDMGMCLADLNEAITQAQASSPGFAQLGDTLVDPVFDGYQDWYGYDDTWILQELGQVLDEQGTQEDGLLGEDVAQVELDRLGADVQLARDPCLWATPRGCPGGAGGAR